MKILVFDCAQVAPYEIGSRSRLPARLGGRKILEMPPTVIMYALQFPPRRLQVIGEDTPSMYYFSFPPTRRARRIATFVSAAGDVTGVYWPECR